MTPQFILRASLSRIAGPSDHDKRELRRAEAEIDNLQWANEYAEPGYSDPAKGILFADWNPFPREVISLLERAGYEIEWSDEWAPCDECYRAVRTSPDSYWWKPSYVIENECEIVCKHCKAEA